MYALFNTANMNAVGASLLSITMGSSTGTVLFLIAALIGTFNKIVSSEDEQQIKIIEILNAPSLTAVILTIASLCNTLIVLYGTFQLSNYQTKETAVGIALTIAWGAGFLGDVILILLDIINYPHSSRTQLLERWRSSLKSLPQSIFNPAIMYSWSAFGFIFTSLLEPSQKSNLPVSMYVLGIMALMVAGVSIISSLVIVLSEAEIIRLDFTKEHNKLLFSQRSCNIMLGASTFLLMISAFLGGNIILAGAQGFFIVAAFSLIIESKTAYRLATSK